MISRRDVLAQLAMAGIVARFAPSDLFAQTQTAAQRYGKEKLIVRSMRPPDFETPVALLDSFITPNDLFYVRSHMPVPAGRCRDVDAEDRRRGELADRRCRSTRSRSCRRSRSRRRSSARATAARSSNRPLAGIQWEKGAVGTARFTGARLSDVLKKAGVEDLRPQRRDARRRSSARHHAGVRAPGADGQGDASRHDHRVGHERPADPAAARLAAARDHSGLGRRVFGEVAERAQRARRRTATASGSRPAIAIRTGASRPAPRWTRRTWSRSPASS